MSVNITYKSINGWDSVINGDFLILEGTTDHPIPKGLYRAFIITNESDDPPQTFCLIPMFDGPFEKNMFPYMLGDSFPKLISKVKSVNINAEVNQ